MNKTVHNYTSKIVLNIINTSKCNVKLNKRIKDDTKAAARQSLNCIKNKK